MDWLIQTMRDNPAIPIFLTLGIGFWVGNLKFKGFSLGTVTAVLLVGVLVGQMDIEISGPVKQVFFLLFLFSIGYSVGPQFFRALKGTGLKQVVFALIVCGLCLGVTWAAAAIMGYNPGEAIGLFSGAETISAVIGVGSDSIKSLGVDEKTAQAWIDIIPVGYAVCYVFGTIGSAYILGNIGPAMLGGIKKVRQQTLELERQMNVSEADSDPAFVAANRPVAFRAYKATADFFATPKTVAEIEDHISQLGRRLFVERLRVDGNVIDVKPDATVKQGDEIVLSGRREFIIQDESWIGPEVVDAQLLNFPAKQVPVTATKKVAGQTVDQLRHQKFMYGISIKSISRSGVSVPVLAKTEIQNGDVITIIGLKNEVDTAAPLIGYADRPTNATDMIFVGLGIFVGCIVGVITIKLGGIPVSLSTSGGALIAGLILGWLRSKHPTFGRIPEASIWLMKNLGLNLFIAVIGITCATTFVAGFKQVGLSMFILGIICTSLPLLIGIILGAKVFKFHPAINLGCVAGSRTTTAALGAIQDQLQSSVPALGYTITYAIGNTVLILCGIALVMLTC